MLCVRHSMLGGVYVGGVGGRRRCRHASHRPHSQAPTGKGHLDQPRSRSAFSPAFLPFLHAICCRHLVFGPRCLHPPTKLPSPRALALCCPELILGILANLFCIKQILFLFSFFFFLPPSVFKSSSSLFRSSTPVPTPLLPQPPPCLSCISL